MWDDDGKSPLDHLGTAWTVAMLVFVLLLAGLCAEPLVRNVTAWSAERRAADPPRPVERASRTDRWHTQYRPL